jgi:hypothetical protein
MLFINAIQNQVGKDDIQVVARSLLCRLAVSGDAAPYEKSAAWGPWQSPGERLIKQEKLSSSGQKLFPTPAFYRISR